MLLFQVRVPLLLLVRVPLPFLVIVPLLFWVRVPLLFLVKVLLLFLVRVPLLFLVRVLLLFLVRVLLLLSWRVRRFSQLVALPDFRWILRPLTVSTAKVTNLSSPRPRAEVASIWRSPFLIFADFRFSWILEEKLFRGGIGDLIRTIEFYEVVILRL